MVDLDDILEQLASQHQGKKSSSTPKTTSPAINSSEDNIDRYIAELKSQPPKSPSSSTDDFLEEIENNYQSNQEESNTDSTELFADIEQQFQQNKVTNKLSTEDSSIIEHSIKHIVKFSQEKNQHYQENKTVNNLTDIRQEELNKQRQIKQLKTKAQQWLKNLDPNSEEGFWFEQFALSYNSKLEAAIEYIKALQG